MGKVLDNMRPVFCKILFVAGQLFFHSCKKLKNSIFIISYE